jgi:hypothetical protein
MTDLRSQQSIAERLRAACDGHPAANIPWPHRVLHEAADEIARLELQVKTYRDTTHVLREELKFISASTIEACAKVADTRADICADAVAKIDAGELYQDIPTAKATENCARMEAVHIASLIRALSQAPVTDAAACSGMDQIKRGMEEYQHLDSGRNSHD